MAIPHVALVCAGLPVPPEATARQLVSAGLDIVGPVIVFALAVVILFEIGVALGVVEKKLPGQRDWDDDD
jgi:hypothetical protein